MPPSMAMPALETNRSMRPNRSIVAATRCSTSSSRPTSAATGKAPIGAAARSHASWPQVGQHDVRALAGEARAQREADALRAAGDDAHLVLDVHDSHSDLDLAAAPEP